MALNYHKKNKGFVALISAIIAGVFLLSIVMSAIGTFTYQSSSSSTIEDTIKTLETKLQKNTKDYDTLVALGNNYMNLGDSQKSNTQKINLSNGSYSKAAEYYKKALEINGKDVNVRTDRAINLYYTGNVDEAIKEVTKAIEISPKFAQAHFNYAIFLGSKQDYKKAVEELKLAKKLEPNGTFIQGLEQMLPQFEQQANNPTSSSSSTGTATSATISGENINTTGNNSSQGNPTK